eukprot:scaffold2252_cov118-Isochrysis_galbana.AAC.5
MEGVEVGVALAERGLGGTAVAARTGRPAGSLSWTLSSGGMRSAALRAHAQPEPLTPSLSLYPQPAFPHGLGLLLLLMPGTSPRDSNVIARRRCLPVPPARPSRSRKVHPPPPVYRAARSSPSSGASSTPPPSPVASPPSSTSLVLTSQCGPITPDPFFFPNTHLTSPSAPAGLSHTSQYGPITPDPFFFPNTHLTSPSAPAGLSHTSQCDSEHADAATQTGGDRS